MGAFIKLLMVIVLTAVGLALLTERAGTASVTSVLGLPVVAMAQNAMDTPAWLAVGQGAVGVLAMGQGALGVVAFGQVGVGIVFGIGQLTTGLLALGQLAIGLFGCLAQIGIGAQGGMGLMIVRDAETLSSLKAELTEVLTY